MMNADDAERPFAGEYTRSRSTGRRCCCLVLVFLLALVILVVAIAVPLSLRHKHNGNGSTLAAVADPVSAACGATLFPIVCNDTMANGGNFTTDSRGMSTFAVKLAGNGVNQTLYVVLGINNTANLNVTGAVDTCLETLSLAGSYLAAIHNDLQNETAVLEDLQAALYGAWELHTTCIDTFVEFAPEFSAGVVAQGQQADELLSNAGSLLNAFVTFGNDLAQWKPTLYGLPDGLNLTDIIGHLPASVDGAFKNITSGGGGGRRLLSNVDLVPETEEALDEPPRWLSPSEYRRMLGGAAMKINAIVARDNSGKYTSIQKAVSAAPKNSKTRWVIYVKAGVYYEQVQIPSGTTNLYLVGDGIGRTVITGNRNVGCNCGVTTFQSATLGTYGCSSWSTPFLSSSS